MRDDNGLNFSYVNDRNLEYRLLSSVKIHACLLAFFILKSKHTFLHLARPCFLRFMSRFKLCLSESRAKIFEKRHKICVDFCLTKSINTFCDT